MLFGPTFAEMREPSLLPTELREKALAARRHGIATFILPRRNEPDLAELPPEIKDGMRFVPVETLEEALKIALPPPISK